MGDVNGDGKVDLLLGNEIYLNVGKKFSAAGAKLAIPSGARVLAAALSDLTGDGKPDALVLLANGQLLAFENPGTAGAAGAWKAITPLELFKPDAGEPLAGAIGDFGDDGTPHALVVRANGITRYPIASKGEAPADYTRLCGQILAYSSKGLADHLKDAAAVVIDINGDHRPDLLLACPDGSVLMVNRGFGTFLPLPNPAAVLYPAAGQPKPLITIDAHSLQAAADLSGDGLEHLLALSPDGKLFEARNSTPAH